VHITPGLNSLKRQKKTKENEKLETKIRQIFDDFKQTYGSRRLVGELHKAGFKVDTLFKVKVNSLIFDYLADTEIA